MTQQNQSSDKFKLECSFKIEGVNCKSVLVLSIGIVMTIVSPCVREVVV